MSEPNAAARKRVLLRMGAAPLRFIMYSNSATFIAFVYLCLPMTVTTIYRSLLIFDLRLSSAASACGAGRLRVFSEVIWPLRFLGGPNGTLYGMSMAQQFGESGTWALGAAMGVVLVLFSIAALVILSLGVNLRRTGFTGMER